MELSLELKPRVSFEFEVEKILDVSGDGCYRVQWKPAWVSHFHLLGCDHLIQEFLQQQHIEKEVKRQLMDQVQIEREVKPEPDIHISDKESGMLMQDGDTVENDDIPQNESDNQSSPQFLATAVEMKEEDRTVETGSTMEHLLASHNLPPTCMMNLNMTTSLVENRKKSVLSETAREVPASELVECLNNSHQQGYTCTLCHKTFSQQSSLERHLRLHTDEQPFSCSYCEKKFSRKDHLTLHVRVHTGEKPYQCPYCVYSCARKSHLTVHVRTHLQEKPYSCHICGKAYSQKGALNMHMRVHAGLKPLQCCGQTFADTSTYNQHVKYCLSAKELHSVISVAQNLTESSTEFN